MIENLHKTRQKLKRIYIESTLPTKLIGLRDLSQNLWWTWNQEAIELFQSINPEKWEAYNYNAVAVLENIDVERANSLIEDKAFMAKLKRVSAAYQNYLKKKPKKDTAKVAYFCMEYGLHISMSLYSGGLGVLAGDFMKEASDSNVDMIGIGLLYRYGYFEQALSLHGDQIANYNAQKFTQLPVQPVRNEAGDWIKINIDLPGRKVFAKIWQLKVGRITLYLLDADLDENDWQDRALTHQLYGGDNEHRLKQEILLGIGGVRAIRAMDLSPEIYHCNEGHAAFLGLERLRNLIQEENLSFDEAKEVVRSSALFTTHTPVPAGHDHFHESLLRGYIFNYAHDLGISWEKLMALGKVDVHNVNETFSMSHLAVRLSQEVNGVSKLHGSVSQKMFNVLYPGYSPEELHIGYVTNSVHYPTWIAKEWHELYLKTFGKKFLEDQSNETYWRKINSVPDKKILSIRATLKQRLIVEVKAKLQEDLTRRGENPRAIFEVLNGIREDALVIGFARRFATYKRAHLLFENLERLAEIVNDPEKPVMFVFSGKAHPADGGGQALIRRILEIAKQPAFAGKVVFLENYNMEIAKVLVQGVDVWLNTPTRPKEASGTSGMKAAMNGVMNFSVLDGWWAEGYRSDAGWALTDKRTYQDQELQNELDAETIYNIFENEIIPCYYDRNKQGVPIKWVQYIKTIIAEVAPVFTMKRMMDHYFERFYDKLHVRQKQVRQGNYGMVKQLSAWKSHFRSHWEGITVVDHQMYDTDNHALPLGDFFEAEISLRMAGLTSNDVGVEIVFFKRIDEEDLELVHAEELALKSQNEHICVFKCKVQSTVAGVYEYGFRIFPKNELLAHKQDFPLMKWI
ncbi:MAG: alpha-glucan family phosphorylase [Saprospiraceae bacterium]